ncbi:hypothetical protein Hte_004184 [Hypoxylon texense]
MADPVSLLGTAIGIVSLGLQVYGGLKEYLNAYRSRDKRVDEALRRLELLRNSLRIIGSIVFPSENEHKEPAEAVVSSLREVQADLQGLHDQLQKNKSLHPTNLIEKVKDKKKKLAFPFHVSYIDMLESVLERIVNNLLITMQGLGL